VEELYLKISKLQKPAQKTSSKRTTKNFLFLIKDDSVLTEPSLTRKCVAEFIGTFILVFIGAGAAVITILLANGESSKSSFMSSSIGALGGLADWLSIGLAFAFGIAGAFYIFGHISGCHINPAVTIALWSVKRMPGRDVGPYIVSQLAGATVASISFVGIVGTRAATIGGSGATALFPGISYLQGLFNEIVISFMLMLVIMALAVYERGSKPFSGLMIGLVVAAGITTTGNISGASFNPARTFGPYVANALFGGPNFWIQFPIYVIGPIFGALLAAFTYTYLTEAKAD
jgi:glycerol uptake facilitator protein